jgi:hypothetical protein
VIFDFKNPYFFILLVKVKVKCILKLFSHQVMFPVPLLSELLELAMQAAQQIGQPGIGRRNAEHDGGHIRLHPVHSPNAPLQQVVVVQKGAFIACGA